MISFKVRSVVAVVALPSNVFTKVNWQKGYCKAHAVDADASERAYNEGLPGAYLSIMCTEAKKPGM